MKRVSLVKILSIIFLLSCIQILHADRFIVINTNSDGTGSLDAAIDNANNHAGPDTVVFHLDEGIAGHDADVGVWFINLTTVLTIINDDSTFIDGSSQADYIGGNTNPGAAPEIVLDGSATSAGSVGLTLLSGSNTIHQICIVNFDTQISIHNNQNRVTGCYLGVDFSGHQASSKSYTGIRLDYQAALNIIGGEMESDRNVISGNLSTGITFFRQSEYNQVLGNFIGINSSGLGTIPNGTGIEVDDGSHHNTIGPHNVISGNNNYGIYMYSPETDDNLVVGNLIGTDPEGMLPMGNGSSNVCLYEGPSHNTVGGLAPEEKNIICDSYSSGVMLYGEGTNYNTILGNYVGVNAAGADSLGNADGIRIMAGCKNSTVGPENVISGNELTGITIMHSGTNDTQIIGNLIGTDNTGSKTLGNCVNGITVTMGASHTIIGGNTEEERNIVSANGSAGINISGTSNVTDSTQITGNFIGTDITGTVALPNKYAGISLANQSITNTQIGGLGEGQWNLISGNDDDAIFLTGSSISNNRIEGNKIGTDVSGDLPLPNQGDGIFIINGPSDNIIKKNIIAFSGGYGIYNTGASNLGNTITQNSIYNNGLVGINNYNGGNLELAPPEITAISSVSGTAPADAKVEIFSGSDNEGKTYLDSCWADGSGNFYWDGNPVGPFVTATATDTEGNTSEFSKAWHLGPFFVTTTCDTGNGSLRWAIEQANESSGPDSIHFQISTDDINYNETTGVWTIQPKSELPYIESDGLVIDGLTQAEFQMDDTNPNGPEIELDGSLMDGFFYAGIYIRNADDIHIYGLTLNQFDNHGMLFKNVNQCRISGCYVGTDPTGMERKANKYGIGFENSDHNQIVPYEDFPNLISGNTNFGISLYDSSNQNVISGNLIGLNRTQSDTIPNLNYGGIRLFFRSDSNEVKENRICGNRFGMYIYQSSENDVKNNFIGTNETWDKNMGNIHEGIIITADDDSANGNVIQYNTIGYNGGIGIAISDDMVQRNFLTQNLISRNAFTGIDISNGANGDISPPAILSATETQITGSASAGQTVEVYSDTTWQGQEYLGTTKCDASGNFTLDLTSSPSYQYVTAIAIDVKGNTSEFSTKFETGIQSKNDNEHPESFTLMQNYPNPFNPETTIRFGVHKEARVCIKIYNIKGQQVLSLVDKKFPAGYHNIQFNAERLSSGVYFYRIQFNDSYKVRKMVLLD